MSVELYQEPIRRRYYASYYSCSYLFFLLSVWILVALPFFLVSLVGGGVGLGGFGRARGGVARGSV
jgi:hypothetical protein